MNIFNQGIVADVNLNNVTELEYTTGNGWTNAKWALNHLSIIQFFMNCRECKSVSIRMVEKLDANTTKTHSFGVIDNHWVKK